MRPSDRWNEALAGQLRRPGGILGRLVARRLNRGNRTLVAAAIEGLDDLPADGVVADLGFGGGVGLRQLLDRPGVAEVVGIDFSDTMLAAAHRRFGRELAGGRLRLELGSLAALPLPDRSLDGAITVNTIYFLDDLLPALSELARVLRPGCRGVIGIGDPEAMARMPFTAHGFRLRSITAIEDSIADSSLRLLDHRRVGDGNVASHLLIVGAREAEE